ncbi:helix-turn-helix domain-containing protein [Roseiterribacter gracilis]|uniref:Transcriptional regulator FeaR n=1 Tax=Roseiterribacter gracilis TaxID=2812848 RepID=A0A8S8XFX2_9PROT|nr:transcriptional regulator FeaR [Rhodospirillales bacterium TMPK1]
MFTEISSSPLELERSRTQCAQDGCDDIHLALVEEGEIIDVGDRESVVRSGGIRLTDFTQPGTVRWESPHHSLRLYIPRDAVAATLGTDPGFLHQRVLSPNGLAPMLAAQLRSLARLAPTASNSVRAVALRATIELALTALAADFGRIARSSEQCSDGLFAAVNRYIQQELGSPTLTPAVIAARVGCSRAHLYRLFARYGLSVADYIREARLQRSLVELQTVAQSRETIAALAFRCGFENPVYFARLFKQRFGCTPQDVRRGKTEKCVQTPVPELT